MENVEISLFDVVKVSINEDKISKFVKQLDFSKIMFNSWKSEYFIQTDDIVEIAQFFFVGNALNFRFWYDNYQDTFTYANFSGSTAMWAMVRDNLAYMDAEYLRNIEISKEKVLSRMPVAEKRVMALCEVGNVLCKKYDGKIINLCTECEWDAVRIVEKIATEFPMWEDKYQGVAFRKRACLFVAMLHGRLLPNSPISNIEMLHCLADYQLPKVLHFLGILHYSVGLEKMINEQIKLEHKGAYETEIRKMTIKALDMICKEIALKGGKVCPLQMDYYLWSVSHNIDAPYHLTETVAY